MIDLVKELNKVMEEKGFSCATMSLFIGCSPRQIDRWLLEKSRPTFVYQQLIRKGIKKVRSL
ncbi:hypothetical protein ES703_02970 [subsurface metagenome]